MTMRRLFASLMFVLWASAAQAVMTVGTLIHDGPATPEQISLYLPITADAAATATAACRYRRSNTGSPSALGEASAYTTCHPLHKIRPALSLTPAVGDVPNAWAWPIIDLIPGATYDIEVTVAQSGQSDIVKTLTHTTRALPRVSVKANKNITAASSSATIQTAFNNLVAGDVIEFADGTYELAGVTIDVAGAVGNPIYIRGQSREGVILHDATGNVLELLDVSYLVIENMTLRGSESDSGTSASSKGIVFGASAATQTQVTIRNVTIYGVDQGVVSSTEVEQALVYDSVLVGNNVWTSGFITTNITWNDDGLRLPGRGNCGFQNTLHGFGDTLSYAHHSAGETLTENVAIHYYRNDIRNSGDDMAEADLAHRNNTLYDNRCHNCMTFLSLDKSYGGPFLAARNVVINTGRGPYKFNDQNTGQFIYNNTIVRTNGSTGWGWNQSNGGEQEAWGFRNNILVYRGTNGLMAFEPAGNSIIDFTHNSWYPNESVWWSNSGGSFGSMAAAYAGLPATTPLYSGQTKRHEQDNITVSNPWTSTVTLGADYLTEITATYTPIISGGDNARSTGVAIPNITDGFTGVAPDRGALIAGRATPIYGNALPSWVAGLALNTWYEIPNTNLNSVDHSPLPPGAIGARAKIDAWTSLLLDYRNSTVLSVAGGGHTDYAGNEVNVLKLETETPAWSEVLIPTATANIQFGVQVSYYLDGRPAARHHYYGITLNEIDDRVMLFSGSFWETGGFLAVISSYNIAANSYNSSSEHPASTTDAASAAGVGDPFTGNTYMMGDNFYRYQRSDDTWASITPGGDGPPSYAYYIATAFDTKRNRALFAGTSNAGLSVRSLYTVGSPGTMDDVTLTGGDAANITGDENAMTYDPVLDVYLYRRSTATGGTLYKINAETFAVTTLATSGGAGIPAVPGNHLFNKFFYVPRLGGVVLVPDYDGNAWFLRTSDVSPTIPGAGGGEPAPGCGVVQTCLPFLLSDLDEAALDDFFAMAANQ